MSDERRKRSADLRALGESLLQAGACDDISPLESAAYHCASAPSGTTWSYDVSLLTFRLSRLTGGRPTGLTATSAMLSVSVSGHVSDDAQTGDPFSHLAINLVLVGTTPTNPEPRTVTAAWHFDRHVGAQDEISSEIHPLYHVQYGGREMQAVDLGQTLLCDAPRLLYPPMDAVLAVDFVVSNFIYETWLTLRDDATYVRLVGAAYRRYWQPWFSCIGSSWGEQAHLRWSEQRCLCPNLPEPARPAFVTRDTTGSQRKHPSRNRGK